MTAANVYEARGLPEWVVFPARPDLGHHPNPYQPSHTRCGIALATATPEPRPRLGCTACLPRPEPTVEPGPDELWNGNTL